MIRTTKPREISRIVYRCAYAHQGGVSGARDSRLFKSEQEARANYERLRARGYWAAAWRYREVKVNGRWRPDWDHELTGPLDR